MRELLLSGDFSLVNSSSKVIGGPFTRFDPSDPDNKSCLDLVIVSVNMNKYVKELYIDMLSKRGDFQKKDKKLPFNYGQNKLGFMLKKKYGDEFVYTKNKYDVDKFNPFSYFDMIDFFGNKDMSRCCNRWGWDEMSVENMLGEAYTVHLYNTIIKELEEKRGMRSGLLLRLEDIIRGT